MNKDLRQRSLWLIPLIGLGLIALIGVWPHRKDQTIPHPRESGPAVHFDSFPVSTDHLKKIAMDIGERNGSSENTSKNLNRTVSMIEELLKPLSAVHQIPGPADWPLIQATIAGKNPDAPAIWVISSYDSRPGSIGVEANATGLAATLAAAGALANTQPAMNIHFVFLPHANDPESPILETADKFSQIASKAGTPRAILCVEAMGAGKPLWLSSRDTKAIPLALADGIGTVQGAEVICLGEDVDLASVLFEMNLPAVRVATRPIVIPSEPDDKPPPGEILATSTGCLVELIRRCAKFQ